MGTSSSRGFLQRLVEERLCLGLMVYQLAPQSQGKPEGALLTMDFAQSGRGQLLKFITLPYFSSFNYSLQRAPRPVAPILH